MPTFRIKGLAGAPQLRGEVPVFGMKNAALPIMAASALIEGTTRLTNMPDIADVHAMARLLEGLGARVTVGAGDTEVDTKQLAGTVLDGPISKSMRASVLLTGPLLARHGSVSFPHPGGCVLGSRPIDIFVSGFEQLGAQYAEDGETYRLTAPRGLHGGEIFFRVPSVTGTETFMMAAVAANGPVTLVNAAMEPEVVATADFLRLCGARIDGVGTTTVTVYPSSLHAPSEDQPFAIIPDRIEAASFLILGAALGDDVRIVGAEPAHLSAVIEALRAMGVPLTISSSGIKVRAPERLLPYDIRTHEYPGFPTDAQAPMTVLLTQADGESSVTETIFDGRLNYTQELVRMGAAIQLWNPHKVTVRGRTALKARDIDGPDIRAGLAFVLAAAIADGESRVGNAHLVDRGYQRIEERLSALGLSIRREP